MEEPCCSGEKQEYADEHKGDVTACRSFFAGFRAGDAEGVDECVDYEAERVHWCGLSSWLVLLGPWLFSRIYCQFDVAAMILGSEFGWAICIRRRVWDIQQRKQIACGGVGGRIHWSSKT